MLNKLETHRKKANVINLNALFIFNEHLARVNIMNWVFDISGTVVQQKFAKNPHKPMSRSIYMK